MKGRDKRKNRLVVSAGLIFIGVIVGLIIASDLGVISTLKTVPKAISKEDIKDLQSDIKTPPLPGVTDQVFIRASKKVTKSVVNISTTRLVNGGNAQNPFFNDPFFRRFFGEEFLHSLPPHKRKEQSLGSGVIVDPRGYIVTNYHVIAKADEIKIYMEDKKEYVATVIGSDEKIDLAVLKIEGDNFPAIEWGDSDKLQVGEYVLAVGNPFGLNQTVTMGIVSAVGRSNVGIADYENFIQTDAAINPGNSGGALVNTRGELVGINTAIYSRSGGYMGIGFAVPSNMARRTMQSLISYGKVIRGWLGVSIQEVTPELARQFDLSDLSGALVSEVMKGSPAGDAGIKRGDVITVVDGNLVRDITHLRNKIAGLSVGAEVLIEVIRDGKEKKIKVIIGDLADADTVSALRSDDRPSMDNSLSGITVQEITSEIRHQLNLDISEEGVVIVDVDVNSAAADAGLTRLDVIKEINRQAISSLDDYDRITSGLDKSQSLLLLVKRKGRNLFVTLSP